MPAIDLNRLKNRLGILMTDLGRPEVFVRGLRDLFISYGDLTHPLGNSPSGIKTLPALNTPPLLNRELVSAIAGTCRDDPALILQVIDLLWDQPEVEIRQLGAQLLGRLPITFSSDVIDRIKRWSSNTGDSELLPSLHKFGSMTLRSDDPDTWLRLLTEWRNTQHPELVKLAIEGLIPLIDDEDYQNLPAIFSFLAPLIITLEKQHQFELLATIDHLAKRSEIETVYFLKEMIPLTTSPEAGRFFRRAQDAFSAESRDSLRKELRKRYLLPAADSGQT